MDVRNNHKLVDQLMKDHVTAYGDEFDVQAFIPVLAVTPSMHPVFAGCTFHVTIFCFLAPVFAGCTFHVTIFCFLATGVAEDREEGSAALPNRVDQGVVLNRRHPY